MTVHIFALKMLASSVSQTTTLSNFTLCTFTGVDDNLLKNSLAVKKVRPCSKWLV